ncbi:hypothetical protein JR316_0003974 [Psilocybe cubensis]|uniref:Uncharacterized protein n=1 Tax=Psilocybe cubensis TaxID=181762 RepID=A0ACB8HA25_PSICU|nr:hypothetical protein JR316_0003974 [Psilocybe cubensis]KAH9484492.1 hypothetical protein JR316_0003974 [Psilocybe cubensis]
MSTSAQQESTRQSDSKDAAIPARGTPEYEAYYYQQIEESVHRTAAIYPESSIAKGWLSLNPIQQRIIVSSFLPGRVGHNNNGTLLMSSVGSHSETSSGIGDHDERISIKIRHPLLNNIQADVIASIKGLSSFFSFSDISYC